VSRIGKGVGRARTMVVMSVVDLADEAAVECVCWALACSVRVVVCVCGGERACSNSVVGCGV
jgi:hypothetical protein